MSRDLFLIILGGVRDYDPYFHRMAHTTGKWGITSYQNCSTSIHEYLRMSESIYLQSMYRFCRAVIAVFGKFTWESQQLRIHHNCCRLTRQEGPRGRSVADCMH
jgi:hypothetical protein